MKNILFLEKRNNLINKTIYFLIVLLPITLVTGPFLPDLSITVIVILFIYTSLKKKLYFFYTNIFTKIFVIFFLILIITSIFSINPLISLSKTIFYFRFWIFALAIWYIAGIEKQIIKHLTISFTLIFVLLIFDGYLQFFLKKNIFGWPIQGTRVSSFFKDELILGSYLSRLLPFFFGLLVINNNLKNNKLNYVIFFIIFVTVEILTFLSGERVAFFFINMSAIFLIITMSNYRIFRALSIIVSIFLIVIFINFYPKTSERMISDTVKQFTWNSQQLSKDDKTYIFSYEHHHHITSAVKIFQDHKFLGAGPRMFRVLCNDKKYLTSWESCSTHPHNNYAQLLSETGIVGFTFLSLVFLFLLYVIFKHLIYKYYKKKILFTDFQLCLISTILISIWPFVPTGGFFNNWLNIIYFFPVGFLLKSFTKSKI